ncbi:MAG: serine/threonine protein kinase [Betaproteobacteria bacterium]|jgi:Ser/Thr protein kinase RdoA (MazF antagonist)
MPVSEHPYSLLTPAVILDAVESTGRRCDGRLFPLNSYENRVYQVGLEDGGPVICKFYRPGRWTDDQIHEEHSFALELCEDEVPVVAPLRAANGETLHRHGGYRFAVFPRRGGRAPELDRDDTLRRIGRFLARLHQTGGRGRFQARPALTVRRLAEDSRDFLVQGGILPPDLLVPYRSVADLAIEAIQACHERVGPVLQIRLHGDCHAGNVLWTDEGPHFVDLDDACTGPAVQDLWMLLSGDRSARESQLAIVLEGYEMFREFDRAELGLLEALRTMRLMHYAAWLARRWEDPAFPASFPWFNTQRYWQDHILELREQVGAMDEPPLVA